jgi:hypothetical protein
MNYAEKNCFSCGKPLKEDEKKYCNEGCVCSRWQGVGAWLLLRAIYGCGCKNKKFHMEQ